MTSSETTAVLNTLPKTTLVDYAAKLAKSVGTKAERALSQRKLERTRLLELVSMVAQLTEKARKRNRKIIHIACMGMPCCQESWEPTSLDALTTRMTLQAEEATCVKCRVEAGLDDAELLAEIAREEAKAEEAKAEATETTQRKRPSSVYERGEKGVPVKLQLPVPQGGLAVFLVTKGERHEAVLHADGTMTYQGETYSRASTPAKLATGWAKVNGWKTWTYQAEDGKVRKVDHLRKLASQTTTA